MTKYQVRVTVEAEQDILDIVDYISKKDSIENAVYVLDKLQDAIINLDTNPTRGHFPSELEREGIKRYREVFFKPYRIFYEIIDKKVIVHACIDGRRDFTTLLERRLFR